jgi:small subunit ribosomal protein S16
MPVKIRLQRHGKKGAAFYHIVIADGRAPRNGKFIEKIGTYNPNTNPASIELNQDKALTWLKNGAQPTDTTRAILSYKGILYKLHLDKGVVKGALTAEQADVKLAKWLEEKDAKILGKISNLKDGKIDLHKKRIQDEMAKNAARAAAIAAKNSPVAAAVEATEEVAPVEAEEVAPVVAEEVAPVMAEEVAPVVAEEAAPVVAEEAAPVVAEEVAPVVAEEVAPVVAEEAAPEAPAAEETPEA